MFVIIETDWRIEIAQSVCTDYDKLQTQTNIRFSTASDSPQYVCMYEKHDVYVYQ